jgi:hypothetical protein
MSRIIFIVALAFAVACSEAPDLPTLTADGYVRILPPPGCYDHVGSGDRNIELGADYESQLLRLLDAGFTADSKCWYERLDGALLVALGDECGPHRTGEFQLVDSTWTLRKEENVEIVLCDELKQ